LELLAALNGGCVKAVDAVIQHAVSQDAKGALRSLADVALRAVEIAAQERHVRPDDILAMLTRDLEQRRDQGAVPQR
jgi:uncharacterized protein YqeY